MWERGREQVKNDPSDTLWKPVECFVRPLPGSALLRINHNGSFISIVHLIVTAILGWRNRPHCADENIEAQRKERLLSTCVGSGRAGI